MTEIKSFFYYFFSSSDIVKESLIFLKLGQLKIYSATQGIDSVLASFTDKLATLSISDQRVINESGW